MRKIKRKAQSTQTEHNDIIMFPSEMATNSFPASNLRINIPKYDSTKINIESWIKYFEKQTTSKGLDDDWRLQSITEYLEPDSFGYYIEYLQDIDNWGELKQKLVARYKVHKEDPFTSFINLKLNDEHDLEEYFRNKVQFGTQANLKEKQILDTLTSDVNLTRLKQLLITSRVPSTNDWIDIAMKLTDFTKPQQPKNERKSTPSNDQNRQIIYNQQQTPHHRSQFSQNYQPRTSNQQRDYNQNYRRPRPEYQQGNRQTSAATLNPIRNTPILPSRLNANHNAQSLNSSPPQCLHCAEQNLYSLHWHSDCPYRQTLPKQLYIPQDEQSTEQPQDECPRYTS